MKILDRYILGELLRAVAGGLLLFMGVVLCVYELQHLIKFLFRQGYPPAAVGKLFLYYMPQDAGWVLPIAVIFGVILAVGRLSGDGELIAMHAGGISFRRLLIPVALTGLLGVGGLYLLTDTLGPPALYRAARIVERYGNPESEADDFTFAVRDHGVIVRRIDAFRMDVPTRTLYGVTVIEYRNHQIWETLTADSATWVGLQLQMRKVEVVTRAGLGSRVAQVDRWECEVGAVPAELDPTRRRPEEMTLRQLRERVAELYRLGADVGQEIRPLEQKIAVRRADPWCALGLALISAPLGIRRVRTTTGVSIGLAVVVFIPYYFVSLTLQVIGKHGGINPEVSAWTANVLVYLVAAGLILDSSR